MSDIARKLDLMGLTLPAPPAPVAAYVPCVRAGSLVFVSGQIPLRDGTLMATGAVPSARSLEEAQAAARQSMRSRALETPQAIASSAVKMNLSMACIPSTILVTV